MHSVPMPPPSRPPAEVPTVVSLQSLALEASAKPHAAAKK